MTQTSHGRRIGEQKEPESSILGNSCHQAVRREICGDLPPALPVPAAYLSSTQLPAACHIFHSSFRASNRSPIKFRKTQQISPCQHFSPVERVLASPCGQFLCSIFSTWQTSWSNSVKKLWGRALILAQNSFCKQFSLYSCIAIDEPSLSLTGSATSDNP